jgi:predicted regulator of Ras-like GTPase activity (Roadblock/LC7/MglB family)
MNAAVTRTASPKSHPKVIGDDLRAKAKSLLDQFVSQFGGVGIWGAVMSTVDGFDVAIAAMPEAEGTKISAMASSISAIGDMAVQEVGTGKHHQCITIEGVDGYIFILNVSCSAGPMILSIVASKEAMLGKLMYYARQVVEKMMEA